MNTTTNFQERTARSISLTRGFSLVELLVTLSILAILTVISFPSVAGLGTSGRFNSSVAGLSETLSLARQTAVAHNTYVWVAFATPATSTSPSLGTLVVASTDGTNPFSTDWSSSVTLPDSRFLVVTQRVNYTQCQFLDSGVLTSQQIATLPLPAGASSNALATNLSFTVNAPAGPATYNRVFEYTPSGMAYNGPNPVAFVEFGVQPGPIASSTATSKNVACFRVPFITGRTLLYRP